MIAGQNATRTGECGTSYSVPLFLSSVDFVKKIRYTQYKLFFQRGGNGQMKRINSIYRIFVLFLAIIVVSFLILYCYSTINLKTSLRRVAKIQMEYSYDQLEQKIKEIELEASSILAREETKLLQVAIVDNEDIYSYVMKVDLGGRVSRVSGPPWRGCGDVYGYRRFGQGVGRRSPCAGRRCKRLPHR